MNLSKSENNTNRGRATETQVRRLHFFGLANAQTLTPDAAQVAIDQVTAADPEAEARYQARRPSLVAKVAPPPPARLDFDGTVRVHLPTMISRRSWPRRTGGSKRLWKSAGFHTGLVGLAALLVGWLLSGAAGIPLWTCIVTPACLVLGTAAFVVGCFRKA